MSDLESLISYNIYRIRRKKAIPIKTIARKLGVSFNTAYRIINMAYHMRMDRLEQIAEALGVEVEELIRK